MNCEMNDPSVSLLAFAQRLPVLSLLVCACAGTRDDASRSGPKAPAVAASSDSMALPGAAGVGDPLFPKAGNGGYDLQSYDLAIALEATDGPIHASLTLRANS